MELSRTWNSEGQLCGCTRDSWPFRYPLGTVPTGFLVETVYGNAAEAPYCTGGLESPILIRKKTSSTTCFGDLDLLSKEFLRYSMESTVPSGPALRADQQTKLRATEDVFPSRSVSSAPYPMSWVHTAYFFSDMECIVQEGLPDR